MAVPSALPLVLRDGDRERLTALAAGTGTLPTRARIVLMAAEDSPTRRSPPRSG